MDKNRLWIIGSVLIMVTVVALGWILGIQPQLSAAATATVERLAVEEVNDAHEAALVKLKSDFADIEQLNQELTALSRSVPFGAEVPDYVDQLDALAKASNVTVTGISVADATAYTPVAPVAPVTEPAAPGSTSTSTPTPTPAPDPAATPAPVPLVAPPGAPPVTNEKITSRNFASLGVNITITGSYGDVLRFVEGLQNGTRLFLVTGLTTKSEEPSAAPQSDPASIDDSDAPTAPEGNVEGTISGLIYSIVMSEPPEAETTE